LGFLTQSLPVPAQILDLGTPNEMGEAMQGLGYTVFNTEGDLDERPEAVGRDDVDAVTAFEILEHLVDPMHVLRSIRAPRLFASIPMRLWFATAYRNPRDPWDRHFHEFEAWQFDWLLEKSGWHIVRHETWTSPTTLPGFRSVLRAFTPRYYIVEAVRTPASDA